MTRQNYYGGPLQQGVSKWMMNKHMSLVLQIIIETSLLHWMEHDTYIEIWQPEHTPYL